MRKLLSAMFVFLALFAWIFLTISLPIIICRIIITDLSWWVRSGRLKGRIFTGFVTMIIEGYIGDSWIVRKFWYSAEFYWGLPATSSSAKPLLADVLLLYLEMIIPRKHREEQVGDIREDVKQYRRANVREWWLVLYVFLQFRNIIVQSVLSLLRLVWIVKVLRRL